MIRMEDNTTRKTKLVGLNYPSLDRRVFPPRPIVFESTRGSPPILASGCACTIQGVSGCLSIESSLVLSEDIEGCICEKRCICVTLGTTPIVPRLHSSAAQVFRFLTFCVIPQRIPRLGPCGVEDAAVSRSRRGLHHTQHDTQHDTTRVGGGGSSREGSHLRVCDAMSALPVLGNGVGLRKPRGGGGGTCTRNHPTLQHEAKEDGCDGETEGEMMVEHVVQHDE